LVLRIRCEAEEAQCPLGKKFGCDPITEAPKLLKVARSLNLNVMGISFHVGSGCRDYPIYYKAIGICKDLFAEGESLGFNMSLLDIGGGFPGDNNKNIDEVSVIVNQGLDHYFPDKNVRVIAEPGRFYVASAFTLVTNIQSKKNIYDATSDEVNHVMYYINDGVYGSFNCLLYDHQVVKPILFQKPLDENQKFPSTIWGPTCDALDQLVVDIPMPDVNIGDFIVFENMGAYTIPVASPFNGFPLPKVFCFITRDIYQMIRSLIPLDADDFIEDFLNKTIEHAIVSA
jgi:ornithine decarboxylase